MMIILVFWFQGFVGPADPSAPALLGDPHCDHSGGQVESLGNLEPISVGGKTLWRSIEFSGVYAFEWVFESCRNFIGYIWQYTQHQQECFKPFWRSWTGWTKSIDNRQGWSMRINWELLFIVKRQQLQTRLQVQWTADTYLAVACSILLLAWFLDNVDQVKSEKEGAGFIQ